MNWGVRITILIALFIAMMAAMLIYAFRQDVNLVADDYYTQEIAYQDQIVRLKNTQSLSALPEVKHRSLDDILIIGFPEIIFSDKITGRIHIYHPAEQEKDVELELKLDHSGSQYFDASGLSSGRWLVKLYWNDAEREYFTEKNIFIER